jgi:Ca-activated chloride channel family protein
MTLRLRHLIAVLALGVLTACEQVGGSPPQPAAVLQTLPSPAPAMPMAAAPAPARGAPPAAPAALPVPGSFANLPEQGWRSVAEAPVSTFSLSGDSASYTLARRLIAAGQLPRPEMVRPEEFLNAFDYAYPTSAPGGAPIATFVSVHPAPWNPDRQLLHIGLRGVAQAQRQERPRLNLVLLIDVSGSMQPADRLPLLQQGLLMLLPQLRPDDRISIVTYSDQIRIVLDSAAGNEQARITEAVQGLRAGGGTAGGPGLATAYALAEKNLDRGGVNRVVLATDGDFNIGIRTPAEMKDFIARHRQAGIYLTTIGVGLDNYLDRTLQALAKAGNGTAIYAGGLEDLRRGLSEDFAANILPAADDVKAQIEFNPAAVSQYRLIGYETRMLRREDFRDDQADAGEIGAGRAVTAIFEIVPVGAARPPVQPLRYGPARPAAPPPSEIAFLRIAYKPPGGQQSREIGRAITPRDRHASFAAAPEDARFAAAVAGFAQVLRRSPQIGAWGFAEAAQVAAEARGSDQSGRRAEFVNLARLAAAQWPVLPR